MPSVQDAAGDVARLFGKAYGREIVPLTQEDAQRLGLGKVVEEGEGGEGDEVRELRELIRVAEEEAGRINREKGGWRSGPDVSKDNL